MNQDFLLPTVSIIVLNYNGKKYLDNCFISLARISYPKSRLEVILVDNASSDGSIAYVSQKYPWVNIANLNKNYGFTGGNNAGVNLAKGEYVVFLNNDVMVDENWLIELIKVVLTNPNVILTSKSLFIDKPEIIDHVGSKATIIGRSFCVNFGRKDDKLEKSPKFVVQPYGASMLVKRDVFEKIGKFDEDYVTSLEDTDFGFRAWLFGYEIMYVPGSVFYHVGGGTGGWGNKISDIMVFHVTKNSYLNILKNYDFNHTFQGLIISLLYYVVTVLSSVKDGRRSGIKPVFQAHIWVIKNLKSIIRKRFEIEKKRKQPYSILLNSCFFASFPEMIQEYFNIQEFYRIYYA
ncbi:MAG: glycosyltransferase family 2 protein [Bacteriovorax sp.]